MSEFDFDYTLFVAADNPSQHPYELQISTTVDGETYESGTWEVCQLPADAEGTLIVKLALLSGDDTTIIHDLNLGIFPTYDPKWIIEVEYVDGTTGETIRKKKKNTEQATIDAKPRPLTSHSI